MDDAELFQLVWKMRTKQKEFFRRKDRGVMAEAQRLEREVDAELEPRMVAGLFDLKKQRPKVEPDLLWDVVRAAISVVHLSRDAQRPRKVGEPFPSSELAGMDAAKVRMADAVDNFCATGRALGFEP